MLHHSPHPFQGCPLPARFAGITKTNSTKMQRITINVLGFEPTKEVPSTVEEYNSLAPKRANPVLEDAIDTTIYRGTSPVVRDSLCEHIEKTYGVTRINSGTEDEPKWEKEGAYVKRAIATIVRDSQRTESAVRAEIAPFVQQFTDAAPFPVSVKESTSTGPAIGKRDLARAAQVIKDGKQDAVASALAKILGRDVATDEKSLARAIADHRRELAAAAEKAQNAQLGI